MTDKEIIEKYREVFSKYARDGIIDVDKRLKHKFNFQIHPLEEVIKELKGVVPPNRLPQYCITLVKKGTGEKTIGHFTFSIAKNTLMIVPKRVIHSTKYWDLNCTGYILLFNIDFFLNNAFPKKLILDKKVFKSSIRPYLTLSDTQRRTLEPLFQAILSEHTSPQQQNSEMIAIKILEILIQCDRCFSEAQALGKEVIYNPLIEEFNTLIEKHFTTNRSVGFYADNLHVHPNHLNYLAKKYNGSGAKQLIDNKILQEAKYLLSSTTLTVKEVSNRLGFENPGYFSLFFRRGAGNSPVEYRNSIV
jgi:AraC family transcriptional activator of pobA